jgi:putative ABC transport system substrate-binding protein
VGRGELDRLPGLAEDLVRQKVDVIVAPATSAAVAAKQATATIPIVMMFPTDPVAMGLVSNLRRPGGNVTGTANISLSDLLGKRLQILKEAVPPAGRVAIAYEPKAPDITPPVKGLDAIARAVGVQLHYVETRGPEDFDDAFALMVRRRTDALLVAGGATFLVHRVRFNEMALQRRLPTMYSVREGVEGGGLLSYGLNMRDFVGRAASYVDKILRGARPGELPVEQPTKFELIVNLRTASALGLALPRGLLQRADEVIR